MKKKANFFRQAVGGEPNTFIGGVASVITSASDLASYLSISASQISNFSIVGSNIQCYIGTNYSINSSAFNNAGDGLDWGGGNIVTYYNDREGYCTGIDTGSTFENQDNLKFVNFPALISFTGDDTFKDITVVTDRLFLFPLLQSITLGGEFCRGGNKYATLYCPVLTQLGSNAGNNNCFIITSYIDFYTNSFLSTNNGGAPDGDITYLLSRTGTTVTYVTSGAVGTVNNLSYSSVTSSSVVLTFTAPTTDNTILKYEVWDNNIEWLGWISGSGATLSGLQSGRTYNLTIRCADVYYNRGDNSNEVSFTTS